MTKESDNKKTQGNMDFDFRQLEVFVQVVTNKSFSVAARNLGMAQASVSERISNLENAIGTRLLDRLGRSVELTGPGLIMYQHANHLLKMRELAADDLREILGVTKGNIVFGGSTTPGEFILPGIIKQFRDSNANITLELKIDDSEKIVAKVESGELELAVVGSRENGDNVISNPAWSDELVLVVPSTHKWANAKSAVRIEDLLGEPVIMREKGSATRSALSAALSKKKKLVLNVAAQLGSTAAVKEGVKAGLGIAFVSCWAAKADVEAGTLCRVPLRGFNIKRKLYIIRDRRRTLSPAASAFRDFLLKVSKKSN